MTSWRKTVSVKDAGKTAEALCKATIIKPAVVKGSKVIKPAVIKP